MTTFRSESIDGSVGAERSILGAILLDNRAFAKTAEYLRPEDFLLDSHRKIYRRMQDMATFAPLDPVTVADELGKHGELQSVGGPSYIASLPDGVPIPPHVESYIRIVREQSARRRLLQHANALSARATDPNEPLQDILSNLSQDVALLTQEHGSESLGHTYEEILNVPPVKFAIDGFLQEEGVTLIGGLSGHGKTLIMLAMVRALLEGGKLFDHFRVTAPASKVIYLIPECGLAPFAHRLKIFHIAHYVGDDRLIVRTLSKKPISLSSPLLLREIPGADVFLDTAVRFKEGDENDAAENNEFAESLFNLQRAGARTITGAHHSPKNFGSMNHMTLENILRGTGDIGAMLCTCWGVRQIDAERNRVYVQNVKPRDFQPCEPFIIQGRPSLDERGYFELTEPPGFAGELSDHVSKEKGGRPSADELQIALARRLHGEGKSYREIASALGVSKSVIGKWLAKTGTDARL